MAHQRHIKRRQRRASGRRLRRRALDPPDAAGERAALVREGWQSERAVGDDGGQIVGADGRRPLAGERGEFASAHETRARRRAPHDIDIGEHVPGRIERRPAADRHQNDPGAGRDDAERALARKYVRDERKVGIVRPAMHPNLRRHARRRRDLGTNREGVPGLAQRRDKPAPAPADDEARRRRLIRSPEIAVAGERGDFARQFPGQSPQPILRIHQQSARAGEKRGIAPLVEIDAAAEIEPARGPRR